MAKKAKKKAAPKKSAKVVKMTPKAKKAAKSPRSQVLPGMEQTRNAKLDRITEDISDLQREMNRVTGEVDDLHDQAQTEMERAKVTAYRNSGVELALVVGGTKLRVRLLKDKTEKASTSKDTPAGQDAAATLEEMTSEPDDAEGEN